MSKLITNTIRHTGGSADNITLDNSQNVTAEGNLTVDGNLTVSGTSTISGYHPTTSRSNRNLIINGAMKVAQRGTSNTSDQQGFKTVDRWQLTWGGADSVLEQHQGTLTSADTGPWEKGFRKEWKIVNGNQSSGAAAGDYAQMDYVVEAQDIAQSGWDYTNSNSKITFSFWVKSSFGQNFPITIRSLDGTNQAYNMETGTLSANTWTKITKTIPGASGVQFDSDNGPGLRIMMFPYIGTNYTSSQTLNAWSAWASSKHAGFTVAANWWETNDATLEITGVQLEVGDTATDFEHRSYGDELLRCQRYYFLFCEGNNKEINVAWYFNSSHMSFFIRWPTTMRAAPTLTVASGSNYYIFYRNGSNDQLDDFASENISTEQMSCYNNSDMSGTAGQAGILRTNNASARVEVSAEL